jgi:hypothetical protein
MRKEIQYKLQGDGRDSWVVSEFNEIDELVNKYMVYEDPTKQIGTALQAVLNATPQEIEQIKQILNIK